MLKFDCDGLGAAVVVGERDDCVVIKKDLLTTLPTFSVVKKDMTAPNDTTILATFRTRREAAAFIRENAAKFHDTEDITP